MPTIAYLTNQFPSPVEPYVGNEIRELRRRGVDVIPCSARRPEPASEPDALADETLYLEEFRFHALVRATWLCVANLALVRDVLRRALLQGRETPGQRLRTLAHSYAGAYFAALLERRGVQHIHVHHGYFSSWIAMVAARLLGISFSMTLHGSDLLLHPTYLDIKLENCLFSVTVSEFNRQHVLKHYPHLGAHKVFVRRMGVDCPQLRRPWEKERARSPRLAMLAVGRLHPVKDHAFLLRACRVLKDDGVSFVCTIAGEGPEHARLERLIRALRLQDEIILAGHLTREQLDTCYWASDLIVLTSRSEGIPLVLMEAMALGKLVLAPAITGIPELVVHGRTGFLYQAGSIQDFVSQVKTAGGSLSSGSVRRAARKHVNKHFNQHRNLSAFCDLLISRVTQAAEKPALCASSIAINTTFVSAVPKLICSK